MKIQKQALWQFAYLIAAVAGLLLVQSTWREARMTEIVPYSELEHALEAGRIERVVISDRYIVGYLKTPDAQGKRMLTANRVEPDLAERLSRFKLPFAREYESSFRLMIILNI